MKTLNTYKFHLSSEKSMDELLNEKAIENGYTKDKDIYASDGYDSIWVDSLGYTIQSGYRLNKDRTARAEFVIVNSYKKDIKDAIQRNLSINN
jgi:hypothetical protein